MAEFQSEDPSLIPPGQFDFFRFGESTFPTDEDEEVMDRVQGNCDPCTTAFDGMLAASAAKAGVTSVSSNKRQINPRRLEGLLDPWSLPRLGAFLRENPESAP